MRKLSTEKRAMILTCLVEGNSIAATSRMTGASKVTVLRLLADAGTLAAELHDLMVRDLDVERVQAKIQSEPLPGQPVLSLFFLGLVCPGTNRLGAGVASSYTSGI